MVARFGERNVFMDVDIAPGVDFVERITEVVSRCLVLIVVMGPKWATVTDEDGSARIADPDDFVRLEVETGLRRPDVTPIPVLVSGAQMPKREELPPELQPIARRNALELSDARWRYDVGRLNTTLDELLGETEPTRDATPAPPAPPQGPSPAGTRLLIEGMLVAGVTAFAARLLGDLIDTPQSTAGAIANVVLRRTETWALVAAAIAVWLALRSGRASVVGAGVTGLVVGAIGGAIGGATWAVPFYLSDDLGTDSSNLLELVSLAITGGFVGGLIGARWRPPALALGMACGIVAGAAFRFVLYAVGWDNIDPTAVALTFALAAGSITGLTLAGLLALDRQRAEAKSAAYAATEPS
jgi:hypothetical protein